MESLQPDRNNFTGERAKKFGGTILRGLGRIGEGFARLACAPPPHRSYSPESQIEALGGQIAGLDDQLRFVGSYSVEGGIPSDSQTPTAEDVGSPTPAPHEVD